MPAFLFAGAIALVLADQVLRSESLWVEWWLDAPLAILLAGGAWLWRASARRANAAVRSSVASAADAIDELMLAVDHGDHVHEVLASLAREACSIMRVERSMVILRDDSDPRSSIVVAGHGVPRDLIGRRFGVDEGMAGQVIRTGEPLLVDDYAAYSRPIRHSVTEGVVCGGAAPIRGGKIVLGALTAGSTDPQRSFGAAELETLSRLAELGAVALEQARMREQLEQAVDHGVDAMAAAIDMRDDYTGEHSEEVVRLAMLVGRRMGLSDAALSQLETAARLHDVGKIGVPDAVLRKEGPLDAEEWEVMRQHPEWGAQMLRRLPGLKRVSRIVRHAHERWDGDGYPDRLRSEDIPIESRIILACDAYQAMTSDRPYRDAMRPWIAVSELREGAGGQFDPDVVDVLVGELRAERADSTRLFQQPERVAQRLGV
jgi:HD-GYP domain-containing protein (c-di-GMP phosphodiesterase class II)